MGMPVPARAVFVTAIRICVVVLRGGAPARSIFAPVFVLRSLLSTNSIRNVIEPELWLAGFVCNPSVFRAMRRRMFDTRTGGMAMVVAVVMMSSFVGLLVVARAIPVALVGVRIVVV